MSFIFCLPFPQIDQDKEYVNIFNAMKEKQIVHALKWLLEVKQFLRTNNMQTQTTDIRFCKHDGSASSLPPDVLRHSPVGLV